jgi:hypothetical protein
MQVLRSNMLNEYDLLGVQQLANKEVPIILISSQVEAKLLVNTRCASKKVKGKYFRVIIRF